VAVVDELRSAEFPEGAKKTTNSDESALIKKIEEKKRANFR
jgi:hypothetical protein